MSVTLSEIISMLGMITIKLRENNYLRWRYQFQTVLEGGDLFCYFDGTYSIPPEIVLTDAYKIWKKRDKTLLSLLIATLDEDIMDVVVGSKSSREAWLCLQERFVPSSRADIMQLKTNLLTIRKGSDSIERYLLKIKQNRDLLSIVGVTFSDEEIVVLTLNGLPAEYAMLKMVIRGRESPITVKDFRFQLLAAERDIEGFMHYSSNMSIMLGQCHSQKSIDMKKSCSKTYGSSYNDGERKYSVVKSTTWKGNIRSRGGSYNNQNGIGRYKNGIGRDFLEAAVDADRYDNSVNVKVTQKEEEVSDERQNCEEENHSGEGEPYNAGMNEINVIIEKLKPVKSVRSVGDLSKSASSRNDQHVEPQVGVQGEVQKNAGVARILRVKERKEAKVYPKDTRSVILESKVNQLEHRIKMLEGELREAAAVEAALYSVVAEHGSSMSKVHAPAQRLSRLYLHACGETSRSRRASAARSVVSGLVLVAKACYTSVLTSAPGYSYIVPSDVSLSASSSGNTHIGVSPIVVEGKVQNEVNGSSCDGSGGSDDEVFSGEDRELNTYEGIVGNAVVGGLIVEVKTTKQDPVVMISVAFFMILFSVFRGFNHEAVFSNLCHLVVQFIQSTLICLVSLGSMLRHFGHGGDARENHNEHQEAGCSVISSATMNEASELYGCKIPAFILGVLTCVGLEHIFKPETREIRCSMLWRGCVAEDGKQNSGNYQGSHDLILLPEKGTEQKEMTVSAELNITTNKLHPSDSTTGNKKLKFVSKGNAGQLEKDLTQGLSSETSSKKGLQFTDASSCIRQSSSTMKNGSKICKFFFPVANKNHLAFADRKYKLSVIYSEAIVISSSTDQNKGFISWYWYIYIKILLKLSLLLDQILENEDTCSNVFLSRSIGCALKYWNVSKSKFLSAVSRVCHFLTILVAVQFAKMKLEKIAKLLAYISDKDLSATLSSLSCTVHFPSLTVSISALLPS